MRASPLLLAAAALVSSAACGKKVPPPPPAAMPVAPPPVAQPTATPTPPEPDEYTRLRSMSPSELDALNLFKEAYFDYDKAEIRADAGRALAANAEVLRRFDFLTVVLEGHCDERGTVEYNLALGERRARAAHSYLVSLGIPPERLQFVSYGKEVQACRDPSEACWARNRRARTGVVAVAGRS